MAHRTGQNRLQIGLFATPLEEMIAQDNMYYTLLKGKEKVSAEYSLVFLVYNLCRTMSIHGVKDRLERVKTAFFDILALRRLVERQRRSFSPENLGVVWRGRAVQVMGRAA